MQVRRFWSKSITGILSLSRSILLTFQLRAKFGIGAHVDPLIQNSTPLTLTKFLIEQPKGR